MLNILEGCQICPISCKAHRESGGIGVCGAGAEIKAAKAFLHQWEEPCLSGTRGSGTIFFAGCNMKCVFCQNHEISQGGDSAYIKGKEIAIGRLVEIFLELQEKGAHNINLVSPTPYALQIIEAVAEARKRGLTLPIVYNTNGYEKPETIALLKGTVDIYLPDIKYFSNSYGEKYSGVKDYFSYASRSVLEMYNQVGYPDFDEEGILKKGLIIRHLVLPGLTMETKKILKWIRENIGAYAYVSLMCQYIPMYKASQFEMLDKKLSTVEYDEIIDYFFETGLENGFIQEQTSAKVDYVPCFDLSGI